jgi:hypothetical protein
MTKLEAIATAKQFRQDADALLQRMKAHPLLTTVQGYEDLSMIDGNMLSCSRTLGETIAAYAEAQRQHRLSVESLEGAIMRQGMVLKAIGNPTPYPESYNPASPVVEPTADGLKL